MPAASEGFGLRGGCGRKMRLSTGARVNVSFGRLVSIPTQQTLPSTGLSLHEAKAFRQAHNELTQPSGNLDQSDPDAPDSAASTSLFSNLAPRVG